MHLPADTSLIDIIMQWQNAAIAVVSMWLISRVKIAWPEIKTHRIWKHILPFAPAVLTSAMAWLPMYDPAPAARERVLIGLVMGASASLVYRIYRGLLKKLKDSGLLGSK